MTDVKQYTLEELKKKLTDKERIFCHQYIVDWNGARAAREAGYSEEHAKDIAYQNSTKLYIQQYIAFIKNNIEEEAGITKLKLINALNRIIESEEANYSDKTRAITELNKMLGYNEAEKIQTKQVIEYVNVSKQFPNRC